MERYWQSIVPTDSVMVGDPNAWRLKKAMAGGGGLMDMGVYAIQGARYVTGEEPVYVTATEEKTRPELFREVDETVWFELEFPSGCIAKGESSYNKNTNHLRVRAEKGNFELSAAYRYGGHARQYSGRKYGFSPDQPAGGPNGRFCPVHYPK